MTRIDYRLPSLGADMESATLVEWLKKPGDTVRRGEVVASVETEKGIIDIESYDAGTVADIAVQPGTKVPVGTVLAHLNVEAAVAPAIAPAAPAVIAPVLPGVAAPPRAAAAPRELRPVEHIGHTRISPAARRRAQELAVPIEALERSAPGGIVHIEDVERWAAAHKTEEAARPAVPAEAQLPAAAAPRQGIEARAAMRTAIGNAMARSKREIPHYYLAHTIDFGRAREWLTTYNARVPVKERLLEAVLITKAVALAAARIEGFNGFFREGRYERVTSVHVGSAIAARGGLVAPALFDADRKDLPALMRELSELVTRVRAGHVRSGEFSSATITLTSLGSDGVDALFPIINPPQVAIVAAGAIREAPWAHEGWLGIRPILTLAMAGDHRVTDGRAGARFLRTIADLIASPEKL